MSVLARLRTATEQAGQRYHRLVLLVGPSGSGKTGSLRALAEQDGDEYRNVNLGLSHRMLELTKKQRPRQVERLMQELVAEGTTVVIILDNLEILFDTSLKVDPLRLLKAVSRNRTVVAAWNGSLSDGFLTYAEPHHPEHRSYREEDVDVIIVQLGTKTTANK